MKTEIENIIYNYADELKIGGQSESQIRIFSLGLSMQ